MKWKMLGYYTISKGDFQLIGTKPLFALILPGFWILKADVDPKGEVRMFSGLKKGVISGVVPPGLDFWEKANGLLDEVT